MQKIISLTSIPPRFPLLGPVLETLTYQGADEVRLTIPERYARFPDWDGDLPRVPSGVRIGRTSKDLGPATKILPIALELRGQDVQILFCDDDCNVSKDWARRLFQTQTRLADRAVAGYVRSVDDYLGRSVASIGLRAQQLPIRYDVFYRTSRLLHKVFRTPIARRRPFIVPGYGEIFFGVGGVVVRPDFFDDIAFDIPRIAFPVDDIWLSAMLARRRIRIYCPWLVPLPSGTDSTDIDPLYSSNFEGRTRQELNCAASRYCQETFRIWL